MSIGNIMLPIIAATSSAYMTSSFLHKKYTSSKNIIVSGTSAAYKRKHRVTDADRMYSEHCGVDVSKTMHSFLIGGSGNEEVLDLYKANLDHKYGSYVVFDPSGELYKTTHEAFEKAGYDVKVLDLVNLERSNHYNPLSYLDDKNDVNALSRMILNTDGGLIKRKDDPFESGCDQLLLSAVISCLLLKGERDLPAVSKLLQLERQKLNMFFDDVRNIDKNADGIQDYDIFNTVYETYQKNSHYYVKTVLKDFETPELEKLTKDDDVNLDTLTDKKTILYVIDPSETHTRGCAEDSSEKKIFCGRLSNLLCQQLFYILAKQAAEKKQVRYPLMIMMGDLSDIVTIPELSSHLKSFANNSVSVMMYSRSIEALRSKYEHEWERIVERCKALVYLGHGDFNTIKPFAEKMSHLVKTDKRAAIFSRAKIEEVIINEMIGLDKEDCIVSVLGRRAVHDTKIRKKGE